MTSSYSINIAVGDRHDLDEQLDIAVERAIEHALRSPGPGVLVTRHDNERISVQLSGEVPFGTTIERDLRPASETKHA
jgi:hypothetical protein